MEEENRYTARGVSAGKEEVHEAVRTSGEGLFPGAFCKVVPDHLSNDPERCLIMHADGAGTKSALAYAYWKETGDPSVWKGIAQDALVMNTDDLLCVGAVDDLLVSTTIGRNKRKIPGEVLKALIEGVEEFLQNLRDQGVNIHSTGGETADIGDLVRTIVVDANAVARMKRDRVLTFEGVRPDDVIVGFSSSGQASYENEYNSGIGSNGLTSARHDLLGETVKREHPETYDPETPADLVYTGKYALTDTIEGLPQDAGKSLLAPTRTYLPLVRKLFAECGPAIHGLVHCTGGGQTKILNFIQGLRVVKDGLFETPPVFRLIGEATGTTWEEMYQVFNMGHRLEAIVPRERAGEMVDIAAAFNIEAGIIGRFENGPKGLELHSPAGPIQYGADRQ